MSINFHFLRNFPPSSLCKQGKRHTALLLSYHRTYIIKNKLTPLWVFRSLLNRFLNSIQSRILSYSLLVKVLVKILSYWSSPFTRISTSTNRHVVALANTTLPSNQPTNYNFSPTTIHLIVIQLAKLVISFFNSQYNLQFWRSRQYSLGLVFTDDFPFLSFLLFCSDKVTATQFCQTAEFFFILRKDKDRELLVPCSLLFERWPVIQYVHTTIECKERAHVSSRRS